MADVKRNGTRVFIPSSEVLDPLTFANKFGATIIDWREIRYLSGKNTPMPANGGNYGIGLTSPIPILAGHNPVTDPGSTMTFVKATRELSGVNGLTCNTFSGNNFRNLGSFIIAYSLRINSSASYAFFQTANPAASNIRVNLAINSNNTLRITIANGDAGSNSSYTTSIVAIIGLNQILFSFDFTTKIINVIINSQVESGLMNTTVSAMSNTNSSQLCLFGAPFTNIAMNYRASLLLGNMVTGVNYPVADLIKLVNYLKLY